jgi:hypothetical protein
MSTLPVADGMVVGVVPTAAVSVSSVTAPVVGTHFQTLMREPAACEPSNHRYKKIHVFAANWLATVLDAVGLPDPT